MTIDIDLLLDSVAQVHPVATETTTAIAQEIIQAGIPYQKSYGDYQSGGWLTAMIYNTSGKSENNVVTEGEAKPTELLDIMPTTRNFLESLGLNYFAVRIAKTEPGAYLWEHRDYLELGSNNKLRLHVPLVTNKDAVMQFSDCSVHMALGSIWKLNPTVNHAISNTGTSERIHLILDCYMNDTLRDMVAQESLSDRHVRILPILNAEEKARIQSEARLLFKSCGMDAAEDLFLKTFHTYNLGQETSYDLLIDFYTHMGFEERAKHWIQANIERMDVRDKADPKDAKINMKGTFFQAVHETDSLPQYGILKSVLNTCRAIEGLESAFIRGSLARGDADPFSDIDLLCVVAPEKFSSFVSKVNAAIQNNHGGIMPGWVDTIVKDFGGVGFVNLINQQGELYQLDLYIACQGNPGLNALNALPHKQEVFHARRERAITERHAGLKYRLHAEEVTRAIDELTAPNDNIEKTFTELCVLAFMIKKCLRRGDGFVAASEFTMWKKAFVKLARQKYDPDLQEYGFYHVKKLEKQLGDQGNFFENLKLINNAPLTYENFCVMHQYAMDFVRQHAPDVFVRNSAAILMLSNHILEIKPNSLEKKLAFTSTEKIQIVPSPHP